MSSAPSIQMVIQTVIDQMSNEDCDCEHTFTEDNFSAKQLAWTADDIGHNLIVVTKVGRRHYSRTILGNEKPPVHILDQGDHLAGLCLKIKPHEPKETVMTAAPLRNTCFSTRCQTKQTQQTNKVQNTVKTQSTLPYKQASSQSFSNQSTPSSNQLITAEQQNTPSSSKTPNQRPIPQKRFRCEFPGCKATLGSANALRATYQIDASWPKARGAQVCCLWRAFLREVNDKWTRAEAAEHGIKLQAATLRSLPMGRILCPSPPFTSGSPGRKKCPSHRSPMVHRRGR